MKMNEPTMTNESHTEAVPSNTTVTIHLNPQPTKDIVCDNTSAIVTSTAEITLSDMVPSDYDDTESLQNTQMMVKKSLKLDLTHNNNEIKSLETGSPPENEDDLSCKSPSSPRTCKKFHIKMLNFIKIEFLLSRIEEFFSKQMKQFIKNPS